MTNWLILAALALIGLHIAIIRMDKRRLEFRISIISSAILMGILGLGCVILDPGRIDYLIVLGSFGLINALLLSAYLFSDPPGNTNWQPSRKPELSRETIQLFLKLEDKIKTDKIFLDPELKVKTLAKSLHVSEKLVSTAINEIAGENFNSFINGFRIEEAKMLMLEPKNKNFTIDAIAELSGFSNKVSFYSSFKKKTGCSPSEYRQRKQAQVA